MSGSVCAVARNIDGVRPALALRPELVWRQAGEAVTAATAASGALKPLAVPFCLASGGRRRPANDCAFPPVCCRIASSTGLAEGNWRQGSALCFETIKGGYLREIG